MNDRKKINIAQPSFLGNEKKYLLDTIESGWISSIGPYIEKFEVEFARYHGVKHAIATHNGTIALHLALVAAGIKSEDEVIVPDFTFVATANSVRYCNATPVLTDVDPGDWNIAPEAIKANITSKTKYATLPSSTSCSSSKIVLRRWAPNTMAKGLVLWEISAAFPFLGIKLSPRVKGECVSPTMMNWQSGCAFFATMA